MSRTLAAWVAGLAKAATAWQSPWRRAGTRLRVAEALIQDHLVETPRGRVLFRSWHPQGLDYPANLLTREPETIAWIDAFETPCVLWDVGANVGAYALYAALDPGVRVVAFEPAAASYTALCENVRINGFNDRVAAYCLALSDGTRLGRLAMAHVNPASVGHAFDSDRTSDGEILDPVFRQAVIGYSVDDFLASFAVDPPDYLKIDVDSIEIEILRGAHDLLRRPTLRGVLIEAAGDPARIDEMRRLLVAAGLVETAGGAGNLILRRGSTG